MQEICLPTEEDKNSIASIRVVEVTNQTLSSQGDNRTLCSAFSCNEAASTLLQVVRIRLTLTACIFSPEA